VHRDGLLRIVSETNEPSRSAFMNNAGLVFYLDYFPAMVDETGHMRADLTEDDLHPNAKGYAVMAPLAEAAIARALR
jgi:lysophospholipase L1-like esterase